ncbi:DUF3095 family protein [Alteromonas lipolytica]|uniref:Adenylate cyclase n=1 Tax=Alteromonas lipolytica TaxID=1856405 RepID=A0A1E8F9A9_9ALTE|nr:DUF3095 family protein [Alteromonas lipolytica]OFI32494.1 hypothetical protein BFC17_04830 [Alteromonas lipolytica]GGF75726.1 hypothetical protein GCM10011338_29770 [Alteromonas lipolytica]
MNSASFYADLPVEEDFSHIADPDRFYAVPQDWLVVISDIRGSTQAMLQGKYKQINATAVAMIVAVRNCFNELDLPFVFGGDGATICVPSGNESALQQCLSSSIAKADMMGLNLRAAVIPVSTLCFGEQTVLVSKFKVSEHFTQAFFTGGGIKFAEKMLKDPILIGDYLIEPSRADADFSGFECRWDSVGSRHGETLSLIIEANDQSNYDSAWKEIQRITGGADVCHPVQAEQLSFAWSPKALATEIAIRSDSAALVDRVKKYANIVLMNLVGSWLMKRKIKTEETDWGSYKQDFVANCDFIKFEDGLKMCISCSQSQRQAIVDYLTAQEQAGYLKFGHHVASAALITCMINSYQSRHIHFIDGEHGGYSLAAAALKKKLLTDQ